MRRKIIESNIKEEKISEFQDISMLENDSPAFVTLLHAFGSEDLKFLLEYIFYGEQPLEIVFPTRASSKYAHSKRLKFPRLL